MKTMMVTGTALAALLAPMLSGAPALAQRGPMGPVTHDAYVAMQKQRFDMMDADHDGVVTKEELTAQLTARMGEAPPAERVDALFKTMDTDGDGKATAAEVAASAESRFAAMDTNHDGTLSEDEFRAGMAQMGMGGRRR
ncbi:EF-hand domain-containing protein [Sphingomonas sp. AP4-R1]|uniref:EF-hand domain-containing protein n=1 Tax=Sphingomonas sp. AP4-R1 TaxID=2735134 RepID=UPI0014932F5E|nr:EF-hand domain-containing protein [Sphingomonas sp. AP4-R1]QJU56469.1 EF-hand domain-containing protein [Sphingomonas sp. AP4-R1]